MIRFIHAATGRPVYVDPDSILMLLHDINGVEHLLTATKIICVDNVVVQVQGDVDEIAKQIEKFVEQDNGWVFGDDDDLVKEPVQTKHAPIFRENDILRECKWVYSPIDDYWHTGCGNAETVDFQFPPLCESCGGKVKKG